MLDRVVLFDMFSSSYHSRACRLSKQPVTLEVLADRRRFGGTYAHQYNLYELGTHYFLNPSKDKKDKKRIFQAVSKRKRIKILYRLQAEFGIF